MEKSKKSKKIDVLWIWTLILIVGQPLLFFGAANILSLIFPSIIIEIYIYCGFYTPITIVSTLLVLLYINAVKGKFVGFRNESFNEEPQRKIYWTSVIVAFLYSFLNWHLYTIFVLGKALYDLSNTIRYSSGYIIITTIIVAVFLIINLKLAWFIAKKNQPKEEILQETE